MNTITQIIVVSVVSILVNIVIGVIRMHRRSRRGPNAKEFTDAVLVINQFITRHNATHSESQIVSITISRTDGLISTEFSVPAGENVSVNTSAESTATMDHPQ